MSIKSNFEQNITNQLERLKEIISTPIKLHANIENVYRIHDSIKKELDEYTDLSMNQIKKDVFNLSLPLLDNYKKSAINDVKNHVIKENNNIGSINVNNYLLEFIDSDVYDDLYQNVDLNMDKDKLTNENKKMIKNYMKIKKNIENEYNYLISNIRNYEQNMVNLRQQLLDECSNKIIPRLYNAHLSYVKKGLEIKKSKLSDDRDIYVDINNVQYPIKEKQTEFFKHMLKKYLDISD